MPEYIRREAAINELNAEGYTKNMRIHKHILAIPAADVMEVRHGQWNGGATGWECSVCTIESNNTYPHCPYCGAVMDGGQDDAM